MYAIRVYGQSCNYWYGRGVGEMNKSDAMRFPTELDARGVAVRLFAAGEIGHWEIRKV